MDPSLQLYAIYQDNDFKMSDNRSIKVLQSSIGEMNDTAGIEIKMDEYLEVFLGMEKVFV